MAPCTYPIFLVSPAMHFCRSWPLSEEQGTPLCLLISFIRVPIALFHTAVSLTSLPPSVSCPLTLLYPIPCTSLLPSGNALQIIDASSILFYGFSSLAAVDGSISWYVVSLVSISWYAVSLVVCYPCLPRTVLHPRTGASANICASSILALVPAAPLLMDGTCSVGAVLCIIILNASDVWGFPIQALSHLTPPFLYSLILPIHHLALSGAIYSRLFERQLPNHRLFMRV